MKLSGNTHALEDENSKSFIVLEGTCSDKGGRSVKSFDSGGRSHPRGAGADRDGVQRAGLHQPRQEGHPHSAGRRQALHDGGDERPVGQRQQERKIPRFDMEAGGDFRREAGDAGVHGRGHGRREPHRAGDGAGHGHPLKQEPGRRG